MYILEKEKHKISYMAGKKTKQTLTSSAEKRTFQLPYFPDYSPWTIKVESLSVEDYIQGLDFFSYIVHYNQR